MLNNKIYANRLLKLADFLDTVPPERFDFTVWVGHDWKGKKDLSCGTTACALGWATTVPLLRKAGLVLLPVSGGCDAGGGRITLKHRLQADSPEAAEEVFGLNYDEFEYLFTPSGGLNKDDYDYMIKSKRSLPENASAKKVAERLREFVEDKFLARERALKKLTRKEKIILGVEEY